MDRKVLYGLAALAAAALLMRRRRSHVAGLGGVKRRRRKMWVLAGQRGGDGKLRAMREDRVPPGWYTVSVDHPSKRDAEAMAKRVNKPNPLVDQLLEKIVDNYTKDPEGFVKRAGGPTRPRVFKLDKLDGLGLVDAEHGIKRAYHAVQAGFLQKDAIRFARRGWCDQAFKKLREAEYETGQASGHAKSVTGPLQVMQATKGKSSRLAMNKATDTVKQVCAVHRKRAPRIRGQGDLPF